MGLDTLKIRWMSLTGGYSKHADELVKKDATGL
jgi:hypothetical protein